MASTRWTNPNQPQTLYIAVFLLYFRAITGLLFGTRWIFVSIGMAAGGYGIANEKKWGYIVGVAAALFPFIQYANWLISGVDMSQFFRVYAITLLFDIALAALLLHPMSRDYQRIWFR